MIRVRKKSIILQCVILVGIGSVVFRGFGRERGAIRMAQEKVTNAESISQEAVLSKEKQDNSTIQEEEEVLLLQVQGGQALSRAAMESLVEDDEQTAFQQLKAVKGVTATTSMSDNTTQSASTNTTTTTTTRQEEPELREPYTNSTHNASSDSHQEHVQHNKTETQPPKQPPTQPPVNSKKKNHTTVSLVTSFFAAGATTKKQHLHIAEIEMSILNNLHNPHFDQVVVILDGISETSNCTHFKGKMRQKQKEFYQWGEKKRYWNNDNPQNQRPFYHPSKLFCVNRQEEQPSYYEMFQYALNPTIVTGEIIVVANADQAFDDTLQHVQQLKNKALLTIATRGYHIGEAPKEIVRHFQFTHYKRRQPIISRCGTAMPSWDAYVFHRTLLRGRLKRTDFGRKLVDNHVEMQGKHQFVHKYSKTKNGQGGAAHKMALFKMNENSAEYSALWALLKAAPAAYATNPCAHIAMWHFHGTTKMHNLGGNRMAKPTYWDWSIDPKRKFRFDLVPPPYQFPTKPYANAFEDLTPQPVPPDNCWPAKHFLSVEQFNEAVKKCSKKMKTLS